MPQRHRLNDPFAFLASVLLHGALLGGVGAWFVSTLGTGEATEASVAPRMVEVALINEEEGRLRLPRMVGSLGRPDPLAPLPKREPLSRGGTLVPRPDLERAGRGGTDESSELALNLADSVDGITRNRDAINRLDRSQVQRLSTANARRSLDARRATPHPMELTFVASGDGSLHERRPPSQFDPGSGRNVGARPSRDGGELGGAVGERRPGWTSRPGAEQLGGERKDAAGIAAAAERNDFRRSAAVVLARPAVLRARAAVPAPARGRPNDTVDSSQEVATAVQSLIHASTGGGKLGPGPGGQRGPTKPASGGDRGWGSRSAPAGRGGEGGVAHDPRFSGYFSSLQRHIDWVDAFPTWAIAEGRGGMAIIAFTLQRDGSVSQVGVVRGSGIAEYDRNLVAAVKRASFPPLPTGLTHPMRLQHAFDATNPAVGRHGP